MSVGAAAGLNVGMGSPPAGGSRMGRAVASTGAPIGESETASESVRASSHVSASEVVKR
jgi:hypothetical protein